MSQTIAIVEDDPQQREHYAQALRELGYRVHEYEDRASAIAGFENESPDLAILDIILGNEVGGGFEVCRSDCKFGVFSNQWACTDEKVRSV